MRIPSLTPPRFITASRRPIPSIMVPTYVSITRPVHRWYLKIECCSAPEREGHQGLRIRVQGTWIVRSSYSFNSISWPSPTFLHSFVFDVGLKLAAACQPFASPHLTDSSISLSELIRPSQTTKARLLHYFPPTPGNRLLAEDEPIDSWCGFHVDHSLLTGLCSVRHSHSEARRDLESGRTA